MACIVAALRPEKNHHRFLQAAKLVNEQTPTSHFLIVGEGPMRVELEYDVRTMGLEDCVHFLGNRNDIPNILRACDVFILSSDNEAAPVSILEAMASGLPVVASDVGSIHEMVRNGETGFLVPLAARDFSDRITALFDDVQLAERMGLAGREYVERNGSLETMVEGYQELLESLYDQRAHLGDNKHAPTPITVDISESLEAPLTRV